MCRWDVLKAVTKLIDGSGLPDRPPNRLAILWHISLGSLAIVFRRRNVAVLPSKLAVGEEIVITECATLYDVLYTSIRHRRPAFILPGSLAPLCRYFGIDNDRVLTLRCSSSELAVCFGHLHGIDVVVHTSVNGDSKWVARQAEGAKIGRELMGALGPDIIDVNQTRLIAARLPGYPNTLRKLTEDKLQAAVVAALEPLKQIFDSGHWTGHPDDALIDALQSYVMQSSLQAQLQPGLDLIKRWDRTHVKAVPVHGDYWLQNVLFSEGRVTGVVDWDRTRANGCAGIDALHLGFMSYAMWSDIAVSELLSDICTEHWHFPWLSSYCALIKEAFSISADDLKYLAILLWLSYFPFYNELHPDVQPNHDSGAPNWYAQMTSAMVKAIVEIQRREALSGVV